MQRQIFARRFRFVVASVVVALFALAPLEAQWPQWRGPLASGSSPDADPPAVLGPTENIRWKIEVPGRGHASPIVWEDRVFLLTAIPDASAPVLSEPPPDADERTKRWWDRAVKPQKQDYVVLAYDRETGRKLWRRTAVSGVPHSGTHQDGTWASASPVTDGEVLLAHFGSAGLFAYDLGGEPLWQRDLGVDLGKMNTRNGFGEGASPAIWGDVAVVVWDHEGASSILALDKNTGETLWKKERDEPTSWATPLIVEVEGRAQVVAPGTGSSRGYDLKTGEVIWELGGMTVNSVPTPVYGDGVAYLTSGFRGAALQAVRLADAAGVLSAGAEAEGDSPAVEPSKAVLWTRGRDTPYVPSPLLYDGKLYFFKSYSGIFTCVDAATGETLYQERLPGVQNVYASPVAANGKIYVTSREGEVLVLGGGKTFEVLSQTSFDEGFDASPAIAGDAIFLRGSKHLWAFASSISVPAPLPSTDVYLIDVEHEDEKPRLSEPINLTHRVGYDNQPSFSADGKQLFYTSIAGGQADIWIYDLRTNQHRSLTESAGSEYSPTQIPSEEAISVIHQGVDGRQLLTRIPLDGSETSTLLPDIEPVGYHTWSGDQDLALFVLGEPHTLQSARRGPGAGKVLAGDIGRALKTLPGSQDIAFVQKSADGPWMIRRADLATGEIVDLLPTRPEREDFTFAPSGEIWMGDGSQLWRAAPGTEEWTFVADLAEYGIREITRIAFDSQGGRLALVALEPER